MEQTIHRTTKETDIHLTLRPESIGSHSIDTGLPFFDHMLEQLACHGLFDIELLARGDLAVDPHHTVEDVGIVFGQALNKLALDAGAISRFGYACAPLDEALVLVSLDCSGRPGLFWDVDFSQGQAGTFDLALLREFFMGLSNHARFTIHIKKLSGKNGHHEAESIFKSFSLALRGALKHDLQRAGALPSTKNRLFDSEKES